MADIDVSKIKLPGDNNDYNLKDAKKTGIYTVIGTQTSSTSSWTGNISVPALYDGLTIMYYLPYASTSSNVTLNLTLSTGIPTGAISCYYSTSKLTTHYGKGCNIVMTYWSAGSISIDGTATTNNRWIANANYTDGNTDTKVTQNNITSYKDYRILLSKSNNDTSETNTVGKSGTLLYNPLLCRLTTRCDVGDEDFISRIEVTNYAKTSGMCLQHDGFTNTNSIGWHDGQDMYPLILVDADSNVSFGNKMTQCVRDTVIDLIYPVGSIYMSVNNINPGTYLTGTTWVAWGAGRVPVGVDTTQTEFDTVEETGGEKSVTLTGAQSGIQAHKHTIQANMTSVEANGYSLVNNASGGFVNRVIVNNSQTKSTTLVENVAAKNATSAHTNLQPYITTYMWKRTA